METPLNDSSRSGCMVLRFENRRRGSATPETDMSLPGLSMKIGTGQAWFVTWPQVDGLPENFFALLPSTPSDSWEFIKSSLPFSATTYE